MASNLEFAMLAAYIDGEGSIVMARRWNRGYGNFSISLQVANTDARLMNWLKRNFNGSVATSVTSAGKPFFVWRAKTSDIVFILNSCLPYFIVKQEQAKCALEFLSLIKPRGYWKKGNPRPLEYKEKLEKIGVKLHDLKLVPSQHLN